MNALVLYGGIALGLIALLVLVFLVIAPPAPRVALERRRAPGAVQVSTLSRVTDRTVEAIDGVISKRTNPLFGAAELERAGIRMSPPSFVLMVICTSVVFAALGVLLGSGTPWLIPLLLTFAVLPLLGAKLLLGVRAGRRRTAFAEQLDDALTLLAGSLRAGHSLLRAIDGVSQETDSPIAEEFARVVNETRIGRDLGDALAGTAERMRSDDFQWVAQAIAINREVGGNLAEVLDQVAHTIRERNQIRRQVKALSAEGKISAIVLILLPIAVFAFLLLIQPGYFAGLFSSIIGVIALVVAGILLVLGALWMMAVVKVKF
ncbi:tight adherence protein B [Microterricola gilva]|uniref:Tight adherence protein B n=1 Tax=Microterricola gilva TaxID=393267 RepID=A0A4Q8AR98_9MICO|nr:type II secretion system F family protein [Microterricola gilva]RZU66663.1 tight adherence protein B [Microterricola gilva]